MDGPLLVNQSVIFIMIDDIHSVKQKYLEMLHSVCVKHQKRGNYSFIKFGTVCTACLRFFPTLNLIKGFQLAILDQYSTECRNDLDYILVLPLDAVIVSN